MMNWSQLGTLVWLRWRLTRNQWSRGGQLNTLISVIALVMGLGLAVAGALGGVLAGALGLSKASSQTLMLVWDGLVLLFLFAWLLGVITELQRAEVIDLSRLMHLPVSWRDVFLLNYLSSHLSVTLAVALPTMVGLIIGLVLGRQWLMALLLPAVLGFFFMITAWTYCLQGWLAALMINQRRRRAIIMGITVGFVVLAQLPNLAVNLWGSRHRHRSGQSPSETRAPTPRENTLAALEVAHLYVPFMWLPNGARGLAEGRVWPALGAAAGMFMLGGLGLRRAYRGIRRLYTGDMDNVPAKSAPRAEPGTVRQPLLVEKQLPGIPEPAAALALANLRSLMRAPELKMALMINAFIFGIMGAGILLRESARVPEKARPLLASGAVLITFLGFTNVLFNQFGFDREGFRALVLLPTARRHILLGKNLALLPLGLGLFLLFLTLLIAVLGLPASAILAALMQFAAAFMVMGVLGNFMSILAPHRIAAGTLKPTHTKASTMLIIMATQMALSLATLPIMVPASLGLLCEHLGWLPGAPVNLTLSSLLCIGAALLYQHTLEPLGRLLQRREQRILQAVTQEVE
jgi:ABC-2 type transport system permease protein